MTTIPLPTEFSEILKLLNSHEVTYLIVGGYAVAYHGHPRTTGDIDVWIERSPENAERVATCLRDFGFNVPELSAELFLEPKRIVRMGEPPLRVEILTSASDISIGEDRSAPGNRHLERVDGRTAYSDDNWKVLPTESGFCFRRNLDTILEAKSGVLRR